MQILQNASGTAIQGRTKSVEGIVYHHLPKSGKKRKKMRPHNLSKIVDQNLPSDKTLVR